MTEQKKEPYEKPTLEAWETWARNTERDWELTALIPPVEVAEVTLADLLADYDSAVLRQWLREQEQQEQKQHLPNNPITNEE